MIKLKTLLEATDTNPTYELVKEYPGSEPKGTIFTYDVNGGWRTYGVNDKRGNRHNTEWKPEYFKKWEGTYFKIVKKK